MPNGARPPQGKGLSMAPVETYPGGGTGTDSPLSMGGAGSREAEGRIK